MARRGKSGPRTGCRRRSRCHLPLEGGPIDRQSGSSSSEALGAAAVAAAVAAIDRKAAAAGRIELPATHFVLVRR